MFSKRRVLRIIDDLKAYDALMLVLWNQDSDYPRVWLREWCGYPGSISIGTASVVRDQLLMGEFQPIPHRRRRTPRRLNSGGPMRCNAIETVFV